MNFFVSTQADKDDDALARLRPPRYASLAALLKTPENDVEVATAAIVALARLCDDAPIGS